MPWGEVLGEKPELTKCPLKSGKQTVELYLESREAAYVWRYGPGEAERWEINNSDSVLASPFFAADSRPAARAGTIVLNPISTKVGAAILPGEEDCFVLTQSTRDIEFQQF